MNRGEMRQLVRDDALDADSVSWTDALIDRHLNRSAKFVTRELATFQLINYPTKSENFTTTSNTRTYALTATDISRVFQMYRLDNSSKPAEAARQIDQQERFDHEWVWDGTWVYFVTRDSTTKLFSINFPWNPATGVTFTVEYIAIPADIATGAGNDGSEFTYIPPEFHDLVVARTVMLLAGPDSTAASHHAAIYADLLRQMRETASAGASPMEIRQEW